jgi:hypothetical protein
LGQVYPILPSDESLGYCQPTLRVEIPADLTTFGPKMWVMPRRKCLG